MKNKGFNVHVNLTCKIENHIMKRTFYILTLIFLFTSIYREAQCQTRFGRTYRVIAYKKGDLSVLSVSNETLIVPSMSLYIPNTFTPNGDGINDTFGINGEAINEFNMIIYNRWGEQVFSSDNTNKRWDGTFQGKKVSSGSYVYKVTATGPTGTRQTHEGNVNVIF